MLLSIGGCRLAHISTSTLLLHLLSSMHRDCVCSSTPKLAFPQAIRKKTHLILDTPDTGAPVPADYPSPSLESPASPGENSACHGDGARPISCFRKPNSIERRRPASAQSSKATSKYQRLCSDNTVLSVFCCRAQSSAWWTRKTAVISFFFFD